MAASSLAASTSSSPENPHRRRIDSAITRPSRALHRHRPMRPTSSARRNVVEVPYRCSWASRRDVMSMPTPNQIGARPSRRTTGRPRPSIQRTLPSGSSTRCSNWSSFIDSRAAAIVSSARSRSSGWMRAANSSNVPLNVPGSIPSRSSSSRDHSTTSDSGSHVHAPMSLALIASWAWASRAASSSSSSRARVASSTSAASSPGSSSGATPAPTFGSTAPVSRRFASGDNALGMPA